MTSLSIEEAFQWTQRLVAREWKLLLPVAFAFLAVPQLAFNLLMPTAISDSFAKGDPQLVMQLLEKAPWVMPSLLLRSAILSASGPTAPASPAGCPFRFVAPESRRRHRRGRRPAGRRNRHRVARSP